MMIEKRIVFSTRVLSFITSLAFLLVPSAHGSIDGEGFGYVATTDVSAILALALDVRDMRVAKDDLDAKKDIYVNGRNAQPLTLASLSLQAAASYDSQPIFNLYKNAFLEMGKGIEDDDPGNFDGAPASQYADTLVNDLFRLNFTYIEADGALAFNVMMSCWGSLYEMLEACQRNDGNTQADMRESLDTAAAFWVGAGQVKEDNQIGYMLYNMAENAGARFDQDEGETRINTLVLESFNFLKSDIDANKCASGGYSEIRSKVKKLYGFMNVVLVQMLLHEVQEVENKGVSDYVEMYSLAILPQIAACNTDLYETLVDLTVNEDVTSDTKAQVISAIQVSYSCLGITCMDVGGYEGTEIPQCDDSAAAGLPTLADYTTHTDVRGKSHIDRDIKQIKIFMELEAYQVAMDHYKYGWNTFFTLQELATNQFSPGPTAEFDLFKQYYQTTGFEFADSLITNVIGNTSPFDVASREQRTSLVEGVLKGVVMYLATLAELESAVDLCVQGQDTSVMNRWDGGAAFFIGSAEGTSSGGQDGGESLFGLAKDFCSQFGTCEPTNAAVNEKIVQGLIIGSDSLSNKQCQQASTVLETDIKPSLLVPLIQATLSYAAESVGDSGAIGAGSLHAFSRSILPAVDSASAESAALINKNSNFDPATTPVADGLEAMFEAFKVALGSMPTKCRDIGELASGGEDLDVCGDHFARSFTPTTDVTALVGLSLDVADMRDAEGDVDTLKDIYMNGKNAKPLSLASLSLDASEKWNGSPMYNIYKHAFLELGRTKEGDKVGKFDGRPIEEYANTVVNDLFRLKVPGIEAEAALALNVVMACWGSLSDMLAACKRNDQNTAQDMHTALDSAAAYYFGERLVNDGNPRGYSLYNLAEVAGTQFGDPGNVNTLVTESFNSLQADINENTCAIGETGYAGTREKVKMTMKFMNTMLMQMLTQHVQQAEKENRKDFIEMYSLAILPQIAACDAGMYNSLVDLTVSRYVNSKTKGKVLGILESAYSCLSMTCAEVGGYNGQDACDDSVPSLAHYEPESDVRRKARIDRDIKHINIFTSLNAYEAAIDHYKYGWNTDFSLKDLATNKYSSGPSTEFNRFKTYYNTSGYEFADDIIMNVLQEAGPFLDASSDQRAAITTGALQSIVMYLATITELESAEAACSGDESSAMQSWDAGAAFFIGSAEGTSSGGQQGGELLFGLAKSFCDEFGTCDANDAAINQKIMHALVSGRNALAGADCEKAKEILELDIVPNLLVPLIQGTLLYTVLSFKDSTSASTGALYAFSRSILPAVNEAKPASAALINKNTNFDPSSSPVQDGADAVFLAFHDALLQMDTDCKDIGKLASGSVQGTVQQSVCDATSIGRTQSPVDSPTQSPAPTPAPTTPSPIYVPEPHKDGLAWGRYTFVNKVFAENDSKFSLDVKEMLLSGNTSVAETIYNQGSNVAGGLSGELAVTSLSAFSTEASGFMIEDPMYNFFRYALYEDSSFEDADSDSQGWPFGDAVVRLALGPSNGNSASLGAQTAVVMNVWMLITHRLYDSVRKCNQGLDDAANYIDSAVALWIGQEQGEGKFNSGYMLYSVAQKAAQYYGNDEKESKVNTDLMDQFNEAQAIAKTCSTDPNKYLELRVKVDEVIRNLSKPLLQRLLYHISRGDKNLIELYALSFIPQGVSCNMGEFAFLRDSLFEGFKQETSKDKEFLSDLGGILKCLRFTCDDLGETTNGSSALKDLVTSLCTDIEVDYDSKFIAAYETTTDVEELARIDLDVHQVNLFMRERAYSLAKEYYIHGRNSFVSPGKLRSLQSLATDGSRSNAGKMYDLFRDYFKLDNYADGIILSALEQQEQGPFTGASRGQLAEIVFRSLQTLVPYMQVVSKLGSAVDECQKTKTGQKHVDEAVALFAGSIEGSRSGGSKKNSGRMLMALGKEFCAAFKKCETHGDATANEYLMFAFADVKSWLDSGDCDSAKAIVNESVLPMLPISFIQGTIANAAINENVPAQGTNQTLGTAAVLADAILPLVKSVNQTSAASILENTEFDLNKKPVIDGAVAVSNAIAYALRPLNIDCNNVGTLSDKGLSVCEFTEVAPHPDTPTNLGDDLYVTTTYVQDRANIALDIKQMEDLLTSDREDQAELIYLEGENSPVYDSYGIKVDLRSLASFSTNASLSMTENPLFQVSVFALSDSKGEYLGTDATRFADSIVREAFKNGGKTTLAAEAAVALNLWMELANELFQTLSNCKKKKILDDDGIHSIDEAVAYWIGDGQVAGDPVQGHLLYALAERMGEKFGIIDSSSQSRTNINILRLFHQAKIELSYPDSCSENSNTVRRLRHIVNKITTQMTVVNVQALINSLYEDDRDRVRIYAHGVVPLVAGCSPKMFAYLREKLIDKTYVDTEIKTIIRAIRSTFPCFGIQCSDIGVHKRESGDECEDPKKTSSLAGYRPAAGVQEFAHLDLDVLELGILMERKAYEAAEELYAYGKHSSAGSDDGKSALSLGYLATSGSRSSVPEFDAFKQYFNDDDKYADTLIRRTLDRSNGMGDIERRSIVVGVAQYMVMYMAALEAMHEAIGACEEAGDRPARESTAVENWDKVAAYVIGHMEGTDEGGSDEGMLLWALAKTKCVEFGTCSKLIPGSAEVNDRIVSLLYTGRGAVQSGSCDALKKATRELKPLLQIPLFQGVLSSIVKIVESRGAEKTKAQTEAYVYSQALLPLIEEANRDAAETIRSNLPLEGEQISDGIIRVSTSFSRVLPALDINCNDVGESSDIDACTGAVYESGPNVIGLVLGIVIGTVTIVGIAFLLRAKRKSKSLEETPTFVPSKGELNHTSDRLVVTPPESPLRTNAETDYLNEGHNDADRAMDDDDDDAFMDAVVSRLPDEEDVQRLHVV